MTILPLPFVLCFYPYKSGYTIKNINPTITQIYPFAFFHNLPIYPYASFLNLLICFILQLLLKWVHFNGEINGGIKEKDVEKMNSLKIDEPTATNSHLLPKKNFLLLPSK